MLANWFYLAAAGCFIIATVLNMTATTEEDESEDVDPWGFNQVKDGGTVDGGEPDWEGWE